MARLTRFEMKDFNALRRAIFMLSRRNAAIGGAHTHENFKRFSAKRKAANDAGAGFASKQIVPERRGSMGGGKNASMYLASPPISRI